MHQGLRGRMCVLFPPSRPRHHSFVLNWWIKCEANCPFWEEHFLVVGQKDQGVCEMVPGVVRDTNWQHLARKLQQVKGWENICLQWRWWQPPPPSLDTTQACQLPAEGILSPGGGASREWGHQNSVTPEKTLRIHLTAICRNSFLLCWSQEQNLNCFSARISFQWSYFWRPYDLKLRAKKSEKGNETQIWDTPKSIHHPVKEFYCFKIKIICLPPNIPPLPTQIFTPTRQWEWHSIFLLHYLYWTALGWKEL